jgi:hypothetical protein
VLKKDWDTCDISNDHLLDTVSRFLLAAMLKHCGLIAAIMKLLRVSQTGAQFRRLE